MTQSNTNSQSFTRTNAKYLASKIAANLKRMQRLYNEPSDEKIIEYELEAIELLSSGYAMKVTYGFKRGGLWIPPTLEYTIKDLEDLYSEDDDPGGVEIHADTSNASFYSFLVYSDEWFKLSNEDQKSFNDSISLKRFPAFESGFIGQMVADHTYSSSGNTIKRTSLKKD